MVKISKHVIIIIFPQSVFLLVLVLCFVFFQVKPIGSTFVGTSPEFEVALYTICYLCANDSKVDIDIAGIPVVITCYKHGVNLGTSYPEAM